MTSSTLTIVLLSLFGALGATVVALSLIILRRGKLYHGIRPEARPRRWVLVSLLVLFAVFLIWFPVWITWPHALISRILTGLFAITFAVVGLALRVFPSLVDKYVARKGWAIR